MTSTRKVDFTYDEHDKLLTRTLTTNVPVVEYFAYNDEDFVSSHTFTHGTNADIVYSYSYDDNGNITEIKKNNVVQQSYVYDANSQLIRENNLDLNKTIVYTYDNGGNIISKKEYAYTTGAPTTLTDTINYSYDSTWKDKLTSYDGQSITYDAIGNPTNYMGATMTWFARQMQSYSKGNTNITYKYDSDGLRTQKVVNGVEHNYYYVGDQLRYERYGDSYEIYYNYDVDGRPCRAYKKDLIAGKNYSYYLITNTRGDVIETRDGDGNVNAKFVYDSWGKLISVTDGSGNTLATDSFAYQISLKYRSYVYDSETGLYYLQSRYYDPETGRFLNADDVNYIGISDSVLSYNAFVYCENNAVNDSDKYGYASDNSILNVLIKVLEKILNYTESVVEFFLDNFSVSNKKYIKMSSYGKTPKGIYTFIKNNKKSIKLLKNNVSSIAWFLKIVLEITDLSKTLSKNVSYAKAVAEILFDGYIKLITYAGSKIGAWLITGICKPLKIVKSLIDNVIETLIDRFFENSGRIKSIRQSYLSLIDTKKPSFSNHIYALFKGVQLSI